MTPEHSPRPQRPPFPFASSAEAYALGVIGTVESSLRDPALAPLQADEGAPGATLRFCDWAEAALEGLAPREEILVLTWLNLADRRVLRVHPRGDLRNPERGVFSTRSPDRPNPIGLHRTTIVEKHDLFLVVSSLEAVDGTPIVDVKPVLGAATRGSDSTR